MESNIEQGQQSGLLVAAGILMGHKLVISHKSRVIGFGVWLSPTEWVTGFHQVGQRNCFSRSSASIHSIFVGAKAGKGSRL